MTETTEHLVSFLKGYFSKCRDYDRTQSKAIVKYEHFSDEPFRDLAGESYWAVREQVRQYQRINNVSGVTWEELFYRGSRVRVPSVQDQLISIPGDKEILIASFPKILNWWVKVTEGMDLWKSIGNEYKPICLEEILSSATLAEWAEVYIWNKDELNLGLCWGIPEHVAYTDYPESNSMWFSATPR